MNRRTNTEDAVNQLAEEAVLRISAEFRLCDMQGAPGGARKPGIVSRAIRLAQDDLEAVTHAALPAQTLHNRVLEKMIAAGLAKKAGPAIIAA